MLPDEKGGTGLPTVKFLEKEIFEMTETTCQALLGFVLQPSTVPAAIDLAGGFCTGKVEISGAWNGVVLLHGSGQLARCAASVIFRIALLR